jgi:hypothetical protein
MNGESCAKYSTSTKSQTISGTPGPSPSSKIRGRSWTAVSGILLLVVAVASFGLSTSRLQNHSARPLPAATADSDGFVLVTPGSLQDQITQALNNAGVVPTRTAVLTSFTIGHSRGFTLNFSWQGLKLRIGWTIQPEAVRVIDAFIHANPYANAAAQAMAGAAICGVYLPGLGDLVCEVIFSVFGTYIINVIHGAAVHGVCVTIKTYLPLFGVFDPLHPLWDAWPYEDRGSWCNLNWYSPPLPNPQGPRTPGSCASDPTRPGCVLV